MLEIVVVVVVESEQECLRQIDEGLNSFLLWDLWDRKSYSNWDSSRAKTLSVFR